MGVVETPTMSHVPPCREMPLELPVLPMREFVLFPYMVLPLFVARDRSVTAIEDALAGDRLILLVTQRDPGLEDPTPDQLYGIGTVAMVMRSMRLADGRLKVLVQGLSRARIDSVIEDDASTWVRVDHLETEELDTWSVESEALTRTVRSRVEELLPLKNLPPEVLSIISSAEKPGRLADLVASNLRLRLEEAQEILELSDPIAKLRKVDAVLRRELDVSSMQAEIQTQAREELTRGQREVFLREQLRAIQSELGEIDPRGEEVDEYRYRIEEADLPGEAYEEAVKQLRRLERMHPDGPEAQVVRNYLDWVCDLPWDRCSPDRLDLEHAREILDADHAHLDGVKERMLEFLGVRKLREDSRGPILCLAGPPGVGKTSLGRSIARAMGREFVRVSLGGVRDEAEIRGHRRTYVGALPGRIIQAMKQAGTTNPVIMLDEIDKLGADFRGDPAAALLEVLDPEQNSKFSDHFMNLPFDLSKVLFIATANMLEPIPGPLRDRMEVIRLAGYTPEEKVEIAGRFLIPRQITEHGLVPTQLEWSKNAIDLLTAKYTHEAGVRNLERQVATVCRKVARKAAEGDDAPVRITQRTLPRYLGPAPFEDEHDDREPEIGVVQGLAWTEAGGDVLTLEANLASGKGLTLTGQLGDVMKESGQTAHSFVRSLLREVDADDSVLSRNETHVHVPAGATPKDGPSAGVSIATAIVSVATGSAVRRDVAMTGEITLRGRVLAVGGVREKALAALRSGIRTIILPRSSMKDVEEIPKDLRRKLEFIPVVHMREVLEHALVDPLRWRTHPVRLPQGAQYVAGAASVREHD